MDKEIVIKKSLLNELSETYLKAAAATAGAISMVVFYSWIGRRDEDEAEPKKPKK